MNSRRWFQFHLLTLVAIAMAGGGMLWVNFTLRYHFELPNPDFFKYYGFPLALCKKFYTTLHSDYESDWILNPMSLVIDIVFALSLIGLVAYVCEWRIRRREARKQ